MDENRILCMVSYKQAAIHREGGGAEVVAWYIAYKECIIKQRPARPVGIFLLVFVRLTMQTSLM